MTEPNGTLVDQEALDVLAAKINKLEHYAAHMARIHMCYDRVKAKADAGKEGCKQRIKEYDEQLAAYETNHELLAYIERGGGHNGR